MINKFLYHHEISFHALPRHFSPPISIYLYSHFLTSIAKLSSKFLSTNVFFSNLLLRQLGPRKNNEIYQRLRDLPFTANSTNAVFQLFLLLLRSFLLLFSGWFPVLFRLFPFVSQLISPAFPLFYSQFAKRIIPSSPAGSAPIGRSNYFLYSGNSVNRTPSPPLNSLPTKPRSSPCRINVLI